MEYKRKPTLQELFLINFLLRKASMIEIKGTESDLLVSPMDDGGMGSLYLYPKGKEIAHSSFVKIASDCQFYDKDNVMVVATLYIDGKGNMTELDIWKTDYSRLIEIPMNPLAYSNLHIDTALSS